MESAPTAHAPTAGRRREQYLLLAAFAVFGVLWGAWAVLLEDLTRALDIGNGPLGALLSISFVTSIPAMLVAGRAADRWSAAALMLVSGLLMAACVAAVALAGGIWTLALLVLPLLAASGAYDVGVNAAGMTLEQQRKGERPVLPALHAAFSAGGVSGALAAGALVSLGLPFRALYPVLALLVAAVSVLLWRGLRAAGNARKPPETRAGSARPRALWRQRAILLLALVTALSFMSEGAMENWSVIYLRRELDAPALIGASGVAIFHAAMLTGRLGATRLLAHTERAGVLRGAGAAAAAAMALALVSTWAPLALLGFLGVGLALSVVAPITFSLAGDHAPEGTGQTSAALTTLGYGGFMLGPALIGGVAELASLRVSLGTIVVGGVCIVVLATMLGRQSAGSLR